MDKKELIDKKLNFDVEYPQLVDKFDVKYIRDEGPENEILAITFNFMITSCSFTC